MDKSNKEPVSARIEPYTRTEFEQKLARQRVVAGTFAGLVTVVWLCDTLFMHYGRNCALRIITSTMELLPSGDENVLVGLLLAGFVGVAGAALAMGPPLALIIAVAWLVGPKCPSCGAFLLTKKRLAAIMESGVCCRCHQRVLAEPK